MSEPLTSHEIEDVLSSIRRLVSDDLRPAARQAAVTGAVSGADKPVEPGTDAGKLLLTPALRVVAPTDDAIGDSAAAQAVLPAADLPPTDFAPSDLADTVSGQLVPMDADLTVSEIPAGVAPPPTLAYPAPDDSYDDLGLEDGDNGLSALIETTAAAVTDPDVIWAAPGEAAEETPLTEDLLEAAPADIQFTHGHWSDAEVPEHDWAQDQTGWVQDATPEDPSPARPPSAAPPLAAEMAPLNPPDAEMAVPFVAHRRASKPVDDPLARAWADRAEAEVHAQLQDAPKAATPADTAADGLFDGDRSDLDEEMLRDVVRDIIREELSGALGERITRNVRKLVRVEINRALTAREFE
ncbi:MAG: hypothetical protein WAT09_08930 [Paracoccaceae bacterium]